MKMEALAAAAQNFSAALDASSSYQDLDQAIKDSLAQFKATDDLRKLVLKQPARALQVGHPEVEHFESWRSTSDG